MSRPATARDSPRRQAEPGRLATADRRSRARWVWQAIVLPALHRDDWQISAILPLPGDIELRALPPGDCEFYVALHDQRTGERLVARDTATDLISDMHVLQRFHVD